MTLSGGETNLIGIWAGNTALFIDGKLFARLRAVWGPLKMFGKAQSQKLRKKSCRPLKTEQPKGYLPRSLLREQHEKFSIQGGYVGVTYVFKRCPSSRN